MEDRTPEIDSKIRALVEDALATDPASIFYDQRR